VLTTTAAPNDAAISRPMERSGQRGSSTQPATAATVAPASSGHAQPGTGGMPTGIPGMPKYPRTEPAVDAHHSTAAHTPGGTRLTSANRGMPPRVAAPPEPGIGPRLYYHGRLPAPRMPTPARRHTATASGSVGQVIEVNGITKRYGAKTAVDNLSFTVQPGRVTGFLGPNGAGKTTTLRLILGLETPDSGTATVGGVPFRGHRRGLRHVGALLDAQQVHGGRSAAVHLSALARSNGIPQRRVAEVLTEVGLADAAARRIGGFSLGMKQRLGIATALLGDPPVLIFDEPVNGMDPKGVLWLRHLFRRLAAEGRTVFLSSHLMTEMASTADELVVIGQGRLIAAQSLASFAARGNRLSVVVRTPKPADLTAVLTGAGAQVALGDKDRLVVTGLPAERVAGLAAEHRIPLHELTTSHDSLEAVFMELTADSVEYSAGRPR
jgi:ABC-2 type transport system ATP-binding protein